MAESERGRRKVRIGVVVSNKMDKTAAVLVTRTFSHSKFQRVIRRSKKYLVHDAENALQVGDFVRIVETRPLSRRKCWRLLEVIEHTK